MSKLIIGFLLLLLMSFRVKMVSINSVLSENVAHFANILEAYLSFSGGSLYLLSKDTATGEGSVMQYSIDNGSLSFAQSLPSQNGYAKYWQIYDFETEIMSFPIKLAQTADFYSTPTFSLTSTPQQHILFRGVWVKSQHLAFFSTVAGQVGFASIEQMKSGEMTVMKHSHHIGNTFLSLSPNQKFLCSTDIITGLVSIWDVQNKMLYNEVWMNESGIATHTWSSNSSMLFVFGCQTGIIYQISLINLQIIRKISTSVSYIFSSFYYHETDEIVAVAANHSSILVINFNQFNITFIPLAFSPTKLRPDLSKRYFVVLNQSLLSLFKITSLCNDSQFFSPSLKMCVDCADGCQTCDGYTCFACQAGYAFNDDKTGCIQKLEQRKNTTISQLAMDLTKNTFLVINETMNVAGHRQFLSIFFELFSNFDHFLLYIYHKRVYGSNMQMILKQIHDTIDYRFQIISKDICRDYLGIDFNGIQSSIDYKSDYSLVNYCAYQQNGEGFFVSNLQYFFLNIPLIFLTLMTYRFIYKMLENYRLAVLLKKFSFWGIIILLLLEGNIEFFFFSFAADFQMSFAFTVTHKFMNLSTLIAAFLVLVLSTFGFMSFYLMYGGRSCQLYDNCSGSCASALYFLVVNGLLNVLRGLFHRVSINQPSTQAVALFFLEFSEALLMMIWWKKYKIFKSSFVAVLFLAGSVSRSLFDLTLLAGDSIELQTLDSLHISIFLFNVFTFFLSILQNVYELAVRIKKICSNRITNQQSFAMCSEVGTVHNVLDPNNYELSEITVKKSEKASSGKIRSYTFTRKNSQKTITFKLCRKEMKTVLMVNDTPKTQQHKQQAHRKSELESINLE